jgi:hypothetical protein
MKPVLRMPEEPLLREPVESTITEHKELELIMLKWLEDYEALEPLLRDLCSRASENQRLQPGLKLVKKV